MTAPIDSRGFLWPAPDQKLLIQAATADGEAAARAFSDWACGVDLHAEFRPAVLRLLPLAYANLTRIGVTHPLMGRLKGSYRRTWYDTHQLFHRVRPALEALLSAGFEVMLTKGAPLVLSYYRNHGVRPMSDIDVCVKSDRAREAMDVLQRVGWQPSRPLTTDVLRFRHGFLFIGPDGGQIDLHWCPLNEALGVGVPDWAWQGAEPLDYLGLAVKTPCPTIMLLHQVVHGVRFSRGIPIRWIPDSLAVLRERGAAVDWSEVLEGARTLKVSRRLALGLRYLAEEHAAPVPAHVPETLERRPRTMPERLEESVYLGDYDRHSKSFLGVGRILLADLSRVVSPSRPLAFALAVPRFLAHRMHVRETQSLATRLWRSLRRRIRGWRADLSLQR